jgi:hypothetical protein
MCRMSKTCFKTVTFSLHPVAICVELTLSAVKSGAAKMFCWQGGCHDFLRSWFFSLFGWRSAVGVAGLLAITDSLFICFVLFPTHLVSIPSLHVVYLTLCSPHVLVRNCLLLGLVHIMLVCDGFCTYCIDCSVYGDFYY